MAERAPTDEHLGVARAGAHGGAQGEQGAPEQVAQGERDEGRTQGQPEADGQEPERVVGDGEVGGQPQPEEIAAPAVPFLERNMLDGVGLERPHPIAVPRRHAHPFFMRASARRPGGDQARADDGPPVPSSMVRFGPSSWMHAPRDPQSVAQRPWAGRGWQA